MKRGYSLMSNLMSKLYLIKEIYKNINNFKNLNISNDLL